MRSAGSSPCLGGRSRTLDTSTPPRLDSGQSGATIATERWQFVAALPVPLNHMAAAAIGGKLYVKSEKVERDVQRSSQDRATIQALGRRASAFTKRLLPEGTRVQIEQGTCRCGTGTGGSWDARSATPGSPRLS